VKFVLQKRNGRVTDSLNFFQGNDPFELINKYGSPLYVYNERIFRQNCRNLLEMVTYPKFRVNFSAKANSSLALLQIIKDEGLCADAMSPGEIFVQRAAGFKPEEIFFVCNNVSADEMRYAIDRNILISVDSLSQLELLGRLNPGGKVAVRFNPGVGVGHHAKVITAGKDTKFGVNTEYIPEVKNILKKYDLKLVGINQHLGSLFMESDKFVEGVHNLLAIAREFDDLEFIDLGGGFGIPYQKLSGQAPLDLKKLGEQLDGLMFSFAKEYGKEISFSIEPGRYIPAEAGVILGSVYSIKHNGKTKYIGTDIGFNVLIRPSMYDSHHDIEVYGKEELDHFAAESVTVVGNICETGDILAKDRELPTIMEGDIIGVLDAGSYGFSMSSNYNNRLRPAEILIRETDEAVLIRSRDTLEDLIRNQVKL